MPAKMFEFLEHPIEGRCRSCVRKTKGDNTVNGRYLYRFCKHVPIEDSIFCKRHQELCEEHHFLGSSIGVLKKSSCSKCKVEEKRYENR